MFIPETFEPVIGMTGGQNSRHVPYAVYEVFYVARIDRVVDARVAVVVGSINVAKFCLRDASSLLTEEVAR